MQMKREFSEIERKGSKIVLPENMATPTAIKHLKRIMEDEESPVSIDETFNAYPTEGAAALARALDNLFGFFHQESIQTMFGEDPPKLVSIPVGHGEVMQVPWGRMSIPGVKGYIQTGFALHEGRVKFKLHGKILKKHNVEIKRLCREIERLILEESIYKGKAIRVAFPNPLVEGFDPLAEVPEFIDVTGIGADDLILSESVQQQVSAGVWGPIEYYDAVKKAGVPFKRGICLSGNFGVGKTLCARVTAGKAQKHGITFLHLNAVEDLPKAIEFAKQYQPAVIFAEDVDRVTRGERCKAMDEILNTIDGIGSKTAEIMVVLTTNNVDMIHAAMLRPGRLDQIIDMTPPDAVAVQKLARLFGKSLIAAQEKLEVFGEQLKGEIPAVIREAVERAKLTSIVRKKGSQFRVVLTEKDLLVAGEGMIAQKAMLARDQMAKEHPADGFIKEVATKAVEALNAG